MYKISTLLVLMATSSMVGCGEKPGWMPNPDKNLNRTKMQFAADAAKRHPYKSNAPRGGEAVARAQVGYTLNRIDLVNLSKEPWSDVEVWVNQKYVVFVPTMQPNDLKIIEFTMLFDDQGNYVPLDNKKVLVNKVEILRDGKMYDVPVKLGD
jgi:predicted small lipoprotein YifL